MAIPILPVIDPSASPKLDTYDLLKAEDKLDEKEEDLLADDKTDEKEEKEEKEDEAEDKSDSEETEETDEETKDEEIDLSGEDEDESKIDALDSALQVPVSKKEVLKKYPGIDKEFPHLFTALYEQKKYVEILPTLEDAKEAVEKSTALDNFTETLFSGKTEPILKIIKDEDPRAFGKIVDDYIPALGRIDPRAAAYVKGSLMFELANEMFLAGKEQGNEDLQTAAQLVYKYVFPNPNFKMPNSFGNGNSAVQEDKSAPELEKINEARNKWAGEVKTDFSTKTDNLIKNTIHNNIDKKQVMSPYIKKNAINDCLTQVKAAIQSDKRFTSIIDKLWKQAAEQNYNSDAVNKIRSAYLGKAKAILPTFIEKTRTEALKGLDVRARSSNEKEEKSEPLARSRPATRKVAAETQNSRYKSTYDRLSED